MAERRVLYIDQWLHAASIHAVPRCTVLSGTLEFFMISKSHKKYVFPKNL
jgi:hypothetical protein